MPRYRNISEAWLTSGKVVRIVNEHSNGTKITFEGPIEEVITEPLPGGGGIVGNPRQIMRPVAVTFKGGQQAAIVGKQGWSCTHIQSVHDDLPHADGALVKVKDRVAIHTPTGEGDLVWFWTDDLDGRMLSEDELTDGEILFRGR